MENRKNVIDKIKATGVFFSDEAIKEYNAHVASLAFPREDRVSSIIFVPVRINPRDNELHEEWLGEDIHIQCIGYARGYGLEAYKVRFWPIKNGELNQMVTKRFENDHAIILISRAKTATTANVGKLNFWPLMEPFFLTGKYGWLSKNDVVMGISLEKENNVHGD